MRNEDTFAPWTALRRQVYFLIVAITGFTGCSGLFFHPSKSPVLTPSQFAISYDAHAIHSSEGIQLYSWVLKPKGKPLGSILFFHGNAGNISTHFPQVVWLVKEGYEVTIFDYRGYGASEGNPSVAGVVRDGVAALNHFTKKNEAPRFLYGQSLGGAVALAALAEAPRFQRDFSAVLVEGSFSGYQRVARAALKNVLPIPPLRWLLSLLVGFYPDSCQRLSAIRSGTKILFIHGRQDDIVPSEESERMFECAPEPKELWLVDKAGHVDSLQKKEVQARMQRFLRESASLESW